MEDRKIPSLPPLTARSVLLSVLLGTHPPRLPVRALVRVGELFGVSEGTVRVALSRMAADGEISATNGTYALGPRLVERARRQDESRDPHTRRWTGRWRLAVVSPAARPASERTALRRAMASLRMAERREGVWMRPDNLRLRPTVEADLLWFDGRPDGDAAALAAALWDLDGWAMRARQLHDALDDAGGLAEGFMVSAAVLRHLLADPLLPPELLPPDWPGSTLRQRYDDFDLRYKEELRAFLAHEPATAD